jgi:predicted aspartyl protease
MIAWRAVLAAWAGIGVASVCGIGAATGSGCKLSKVAEWPVRLERNVLLVDGSVNGRLVGVMLDTGATRSLLFRAAAARLEVPRVDAKRDRMFGVGGETRIEIAFLDEFRVGDFTRNKLRMMIAGDRDFGADVLLGEDFLQLVDVEFDLAHNLVRLFEPQNCDGVALAYWATDALGEVAMDAVLASHPQIVLTVAIDGQSISALLDSGASVSVLDKPTAARLGVTPETQGVVAAGRNFGLGGKTLQSWSGPFRSFTIGNETIRDIRIPFSDLFHDARYSVIGSHIPVRVEGVQQMLLGVDFLRSHRVLVSHSQRRVYFTYNGGPVFQRLRPAAADDPRLANDPKPANGK